MKSIKRPDLYLRLRQDILHYVRRVPKAVQHIEPHTLIYRSLETDSNKIARQRRDICEAADDQRWSEIAPSQFSSDHGGAHAKSFGYSYVPDQELANRAALEDVIRRIDALGQLTEAPTPKLRRDADALFGLVDPSPVPLTQACPALILCTSLI